MHMCVVHTGYSMHVEVRELKAGSLIPLGMKLGFPGLHSKHFYLLSYLTSLHIYFIYFWSVILISVIDKNLESDTRVKAERSELSLFIFFYVEFLFSSVLKEKEFNTFVCHFTIWKLCPYFCFSKYSKVVQADIVIPIQKFRPFIEAPVNEMMSAHR